LGKNPLVSFPQRANNALKKKSVGQGPPSEKPPLDLELVARWSRLHIRQGLIGALFIRTFVVDVWARRAAADARVANHFAALHACASDGRERGKVRIPGGDSETMIDNHQAAIACMILAMVIIPSAVA